MSAMYHTNCGCGSAENSRVSGIYHHLAEASAPLAMAYVPYQKWEMPYDLCTGLRAGTIFSALNKPFCGKGGKCW